MMPFTDPKVVADILQLLGRLDERGQEHSQALARLEDVQNLQNGALKAVGVWQQHAEDRFSAVNAAMTAFSTQLDQRCIELRASVTAVDMKVEGHLGAQPPCSKPEWRAAQWGPQAAVKAEKKKQTRGYIRQFVIVAAMIVVGALLGHPDKLGEALVALLSFLK